MLNETAYRRLRGKLGIDQLRIDEELMEQPGLVMEAAENLAEALQIRDNCKHRLDIITATEAMRLREVPVSDDGKAPKKRTESQVMEEKSLAASVEEANSELELAKYDLALWNGLFDALKEKSSSLKRVAELLISGYLTPAQVYQQRRAEMAEVRRPTAEITPRRR